MYNLFLKSYMLSPHILMFVLQQTIVNGDFITLLIYYYKSISYVRSVLSASLQNEINNIILLLYNNNLEKFFRLVIYTTA